MTAALWLLAVLAAAASAGLAVPLGTPLPSGGRGTEAPVRARDEMRVLRVSGTGAVGLGAAVLVGGASGAAVGCLAGAVTWWLTGRMEPPAVRRRRERLVAQLPPAVDLLAACLAVGMSPSTALDQVTAVSDPPLSEELAAVSARLALGVDPVTVWRDLASHQQLGGLGRTVARALDTGASVSDAMVRLAEDQRAANRAAMETKARAVGVKAALPLGVCLLPAFILVGVVPLVAGSVALLAP